MVSVNIDNKLYYVLTKDEVMTELTDWADFFAMSRHSGPNGKNAFININTNHVKYTNTVVTSCVFKGVFSEQVVYDINDGNPLDQKTAITEWESLVEGMMENLYFYTDPDGRPLLYYFDWHSAIHQMAFMEKFAPRV